MKKQSVWAFPVVVLLLASAVWADRIPVANPFFNIPELGPGEFTTGFIPDWQTTGVSGVFHPTSSHFHLPIPSNYQSAYSNGGTISQVLSATLRSSTTYTLTVYVGKRLDCCALDYSIQLYAGGQLLASDNSQDPAPGDFAASVATFSSDAPDPLEGMPLQIVLTSSKPQANFTSVTLDAVPFGGTLLSIVVSPSNPSIEVGGTQQFTATGTFSDGSMRDITSLVTWSSSKSTVGQVDASGLATGLAVGVTTIAATSGKVVGRTDLTVTERRTFAVGSGPIELAFDGVNIWVTNQRSNDVTKLRASDGANLGTFPVDFGPVGIAFDGANIWVACGNGVSELASDGSLQRHIMIEGLPWGVAFDGANIWVSSSIRQLTKLRASDGLILGTTPVGDFPADVIFTPGFDCFQPSPDVGCIWVTGSESDYVSKVRSSDLAQTACFTGRNPEGITFDGVNIWVANRGSDYLTKRRAIDCELSGNIPVGTSSWGVAFDGANIWATNQFANRVTALRGSDGVVLGTFPVGNGPLGIVFDGANVWVANSGSGTVTKIPIARVGAVAKKGTRSR